MEPQTYANHRQYVLLFHKVLLPMLFLTLMGSVVNLYESVGDHQRLYSAALIVVLSLAGILLALASRVAALKAQDRAIRCEENLRHFVLTGKLLDSRLRTSQVIALRFAPDIEFVPLAIRAADENLTADAIKRAIKLWKPDTYRA